MADANLAEVYNYFADTYKGRGGMKQFREDWNELTDNDKADLKKGIGDGTFNY